ncbi:MAG: TIGR03936 family radical SAM-associated protein [Candidatus Aegiribacteria sp.]|nr:TIGR03936 family radical SAM-associated protein [Candidatus Aegiribacteria sp.]
MICSDHPYGRYLLEVRRPQQYTGGEWNLDVVDRGKPRITLVYPDIYELGMSNFGLDIVRYILLSSHQFDVRRAFCPAPDMDDIINRESLDWVDLEGWDPVRSSSVVGFSIPSEALYTNVLHLITRMGLPLRSKNRDDDSPIILLGGGGLANPLPLAPFTDIFFLGEIEERAVELFSILSSSDSRMERLERACEIPGVYVPELGKKAVEIQRISDLRTEYAPVRQLVPNSKVSQDRGVVEIARGCTRGCRFCQASQIYRPVRERPPEEIVDLMDRVLVSTGWEKSGLLTLSLSDYSRLPELIKGLDMLADRHHVSIGRPSMRPDTISRLEEGYRITGRITIAPEAGTESLRAKINKPISDELILEAADAVFRMGAKGIKLYFMLGLPEETDEDVRGIAELALNIAAIARRHHCNPKKSVTVALSPFVPKAQTPLQWSAQMTENELMRRIRIVRKICGRKVSLSWNSPMVAVVEGLLSLGDDGDTADMLEKASIRGAKFDAWTDRFRWDIWKDLIGEYNHLLKRLQEGIEPGKDLPWSFVSTGVSEAFLEEERKKYSKGQNTPDCREEGCAGCGACSGTGHASQDHPVRAFTSDISVSAGKCAGVLRVRYSKTGCAGYTSHLDMVRMWGRVLRRSDLPVSWSDGYVSRPRVHFGPPLPLGIVSIAEYLDIQLNTIPPGGIEELLNRFMPAGIRVEEIWTLAPDTLPPDEGQVAASYSVSSNCDVWTTGETERIAELLGKSEHVLEVSVKGNYVILMTRTDSRKSRPDLLLSEILDYSIEIERTEIYSSCESSNWRSLRSHSRDLEKMFFES